LNHFIEASITAFKEGKTQKCSLYTSRLVGFSWYRPAILRRNKHWNNTPATAIFTQFHT